MRHDIRVGGPTMGTRIYRDDTVTLTCRARDLVRDWARVVKWAQFALLTRFVPWNRDE